MEGREDGKIFEWVCAITYFDFCNIYIECDHRMCDVVDVGQVSLDVGVQFLKLTVLTQGLQGAVIRRICILTTYLRK